MQDKVGSNIPTEKEIEKLVDDLGSIGARLRKFTINLTLEERKRTTKFRPGGEAVVSTLGALVGKHELALPRISVDGMEDDLALAKRLQPLQEALAGLAQAVDDTVLEAQSECWWAATAYYTALARMTDSDPELEAALRPVVDFFAVGRRKPKPE